MASFLSFKCIYYFVSLFLFVSTSGVNCLERLVSEMTHFVSSETLNPAHSLTKDALLLWKYAACRLLHENALIKVYRLHLIMCILTIFSVIGLQC